MCQGKTVLVTQVCLRRQESAMTVESETLGVVPGVAVGVHTARHSQMKACRLFSEPL